MLASGPKSYYEDYVRKKDSERALTKPPALLTDRNAYINFLEVQLERVSAACFAVQSYEDRFNDMQGLIVSLDERCNNTTRLISIAQQGTEVRLYNTSLELPTLTQENVYNHFNRKYVLRHIKELILSLKWSKHFGQTQRKRSKL